MILANEHEIGTRIYVRPCHPYGSTVYVGTVELRPDARHGIYGEAVDGAEAVPVTPGWRVLVEEPRHTLGGFDEPDAPDEGDVSDIEADRYERGLESVAERRGWA